MSSINDEHRDISPDASLLWLPDQSGGSIVRVLNVKPQAGVNTTEINTSVPQDHYSRQRLQ
jgi:hypothetical protein